MNKIILVDVDGVLCNWQDAFNEWMIKKGYVKSDAHDSVYHINEQFNIDRTHAWELVHQFNNSAAMGFLPALRDAVPYVNRLFLEGYTFHAITSISDDVYAQRLREMNLRELFDPDAFSRITCLATGADKHDALEPYRDSGLWWVEDKAENAILGAEMGLKSLLMDHRYNSHVSHPGVTRVQNWKEIYELITS